MSAIAVSDSMCSGHDGYAPRQVAETVPWFKVDGKPVVVDGCLFPNHSNGHSSHPGNAVTTRPWFAIGGKGVVCVGDPVSCGSTVATGYAAFQVQ